VSEPDLTVASGLAAGKGMGLRVPSGGPSSASGGAPWAARVRSEVANLVAGGRPPERHAVTAGAPREVLRNSALRAAS